MSSTSETYYETGSTDVASDGSGLRRKPAWEEKSAASHRVRDVETKQLPSVDPQRFDIMYIFGEAPGDLATLRPGHRVAIIITQIAS